METRYVKLDSSEALNSEKKLLATEINFLNIVKKNQDYKLLRTLELKKKLTLRTKLEELKTKINSLRKILPNTKIPEKEEFEITSVKRSSLEQELKEIKEKLARLS